MNFDVHLGVLAEHLDTFTEGLEIDGYDPRADGDGWESWGQRPGTDRNDDETRHVTVRCDSVSAAMEFAGTAAAEYDQLRPLTRQSDEDHNGILLAVTTADDWSEQVTVFYDHAHGDRIRLHSLNLFEDRIVTVPTTSPQGDRQAVQARAALEIGVLLGASYDWDDPDLMLEQIAAILRRAGFAAVDDSSTVDDWVRIADTANPPISH